MAPTGGVSNRRQRTDYYALLGVAPEATFRAIEAAYWLRATGEADSGRIAALNEAYEVLGHTERRAAYDAQRAALERLQPAQEPEAEPPARGNPGLRSKLQWFLQ